MFVGTTYITDSYCTLQEHSLLRQLTGNKAMATLCLVCGASSSKFVSLHESRDGGSVEKEDVTSGCNTNLGPWRCSHSSAYASQVYIPIMQ